MIYLFISFMTWQVTSNSSHFNFLSDIMTDFTPTYGHIFNTFIDSNTNDI